MKDKWRLAALIVYLVICVYDFMLVPIYYGVARMGLDLAEYMQYLALIEDPLVQMEYLKKLVSQHEPFIFHSSSSFFSGWFKKIIFIDILQLLGD